MQQHKFMRAASLHWSSLGGFASRTLSPMSCTRLLPLAVAFGSCVTSNSLHGLPLIIAYPFFLSSSGCTLVVAPSSTISLCAHFRSRRSTSSGLTRSRRAGLQGVKWRTPGSFSSEFRLAVLSDATRHRILCRRNDVHCVINPPQSLIRGATRYMAQSWRGGR
jgi:hypothetical protein